MASRGCSSIADDFVAGVDSRRARVVSREPASSRIDAFGITDEDQLSSGSFTSARNAPGTHSGGPLSPLITSTAIDGMRCAAERRAGRSALFFGLDFGRLLDDALAAIETIRGDAMTQMRLAGLRIDRQRGLRQRIVRTVHAALGRCLSTFLNGHGQSSSGELHLRFISSPSRANGF